MLGFGDAGSSWTRIRGSSSNIFIIIEGWKWVIKIIERAREKNEERMLLVSITLFVLSD